MNTLTKKGMTLFELLAVIVILGIVAAIAFPTVNTLINNTKKDAIASNANSFFQSAITNAKSDYTANGYEASQTYYVYADNVEDVDVPIAEVEGTEIIDLTSDFTKLDVAYITIVITTTETAETTVTLSSYSYDEGDYFVKTGVNLTEDDPTVTRKDIDNN